jgi:hypothetical protein
MPSGNARPSKVLRMDELRSHYRLIQYALGNGTLGEWALVCDEPEVYRAWRDAEEAAEDR